MFASETSFRLFMTVAVAITLALAGFSFARSESQGNKIERQQTQQSTDRESAVLKNVEARRSDCEQANRLRAGLRAGVIQGEKERPLLLTLLPQFNSPKVRALITKEDRRQLKAFAKIDCRAYSLEAIPPAGRTKISLEEQEAEITRLALAAKASAERAAKSRVVTVTQRCELTELVLENAHGPTVGRLRRSLAGCHRQLLLVEKEAGG